MYLEIGNQESLVPELVRRSQQVDIKPGPGGSRFSAWTPTLEIFGPLMATAFPTTRIVHLAVVALYPSSQIVAHTDAPIAGVRYHLPFQLNPGCWVFSHGLWQQLKLGWLYQMDPTQVHGAVNWGETIRLHLLVDVG